MKKIKIFLTTILIMVTSVLFSQTEQTHIYNGENIQKILKILKKAPADTAGMKLARWGIFSPRDTARYWAEGKVKENIFSLFRQELRSQRIDTFTLVNDPKYSIRKKIDPDKKEKPNPAIAKGLQDLLNQDINRWTAVLPSHRQYLDDIAVVSK